MGFFDILSSLFNDSNASRRETLGEFEKKNNLPPGAFRNPSGRDTRSDKLMDNVRKGKDYFKGKK